MLVVAAGKKVCAPLADVCAIAPLGASAGNRDHPAPMHIVRQESFAILRDTLRWRVAMVLCVLILLLMAVLGAVNVHLGIRDNSWLAAVVFVIDLCCIGMLLWLPKRQAGYLFFVVIVALLVMVVMYGWHHGRHMQHWAYVFPPAVIFLMPARSALVAMIAYGAYTSAITAALLPAIEVIRFASGYGLLVCFMFTYASLQESAASMLRFHSDHDALTNCLNRRTFNEALDEIEQSGVPAVFLLIDIDHFKSINDTHGHLIGDRAITEVAARLGRELDSGTPLYRYGGEEFSLLLKDVSLDRAQALAERLRRAVADGPLANLNLTVSIGVAVWPGKPAPLAEALARADAALYSAKRGGRNRVEVG